jgi:glucose-1-phosphate thymidylyltransferase
VLSGGKGTRLRPLTFTCAKQLIPIANKPILGYVLDQVASANIKSTGIIISSKTGQYVKDYVKDGLNWNLKIQYIPQKPLGLAHAVKTAKHFLGYDSFVMCLGDNITDQGLTAFIKKFKNEKLDALILLKEVENPSDFGIAQLDKEGNIIKLVEKPKTPMGNLAIIGTCLFSNKIHVAIEKIKPSWRGELEITDAIQEMINMGFSVKAEILHSWWIDTGKKDNILTANAKILDIYLQHDVQGTLTCSTVYDKAKIAFSTKIINSTIHGPCIIGENVTVENSLIGPYTSIGNNSYITNSHVKNSIIQENTTIKNINLLENNITEKNTKITPKNNTTN